MLALLGIPGDLQTVADQKRYTTEAVAVNTIRRVLGAIPLVIPPLGSDLLDDTLLTTFDGLMVPGGLSNVHPTLYGELPTAEFGPFDRARDSTSLPLIRAALARGIPILMTCRGFQELNVALGGTLRKESDNLSEEKKHGTPASAKTEDERFAIRHTIEVVPGGKLAAIVGSTQVRVNSLHSQLIDRLAPGLVVEATAQDGSIEAVSVEAASGFALGVVFHPEYWAEKDPPSLAILKAFGRAVERYAARKRVSVAREAAHV